MNSISLKLGKPGHTTLRSNQPKPSVSLWKRFSLIALAVTVATSGIVVPTQAAPGDYVWEKAGTNLTGDQAYWSDIASSSDGSTLLAITNDTSSLIHMSRDFGQTWKMLTSAGSKSWRSVAVSADGTMLVAATVNGYIYLV